MWALYEMIELIKKSLLNQSMTKKMNFLVELSAHKFDKGPILNWSIPNSSEFLLVIVQDKENPIGIIYHGGPEYSHDVGWWLAQEYRGKRYGSQAIDILAEHLKGVGVTGIGSVTIDTYQGEYDEASSKLVQRLKQYFI